MFREKCFAGQKLSGNGDIMMVSEVFRRSSNYQVLYNLSTDIATRIDCERREKKNEKESKKSWLREAIWMLCSKQLGIDSRQRIINIW